MDNNQINIIITIYNFRKGILNDNVILVIDIAINASPPIACILAWIYLDIRFSGNIFLSLRYEKKEKKFNKDPKLSLFKINERRYYL